MLVLKREAGVNPAPKKTRTSGPKESKTSYRQKAAPGGSPSAGTSDSMYRRPAGCLLLAGWLAWPRHGFRAGRLPPAESPNVPGLPWEQ